MTPQHYVIEDGKLYGGEYPGAKQPAATEDIFINDDGGVNVIKPGPEFERVSRSQLGEGCYASPAISEGQVFVRGFRHLYCFGKRTGS